MEKTNFFLKESISILPRVLGLIDRNSKSHTFGCSDRNYWHYLLHDLPNARLQDTAWLLTLIYILELPENRYARNSKILEWAVAAVSYWSQIQHKNGAFDEIYPYEYSYCATAFSTWWIGETFLKLMKIQKRIKQSKMLIETKDHEKIITALNKAADWLSTHSNIEVGNQEAAAAVALKVVSIISGNERFEKSAQKKVGNLMENQHTDGYYPEYGGADIGYHSLSLCCLATYRNHSKKSLELTDSLHNAVRFLGSKIDENGLYDWQKTSRQTQYLYPYGLAACFEEGGKYVLERYMDGLAKDYVIRPSWMDDRYCTFMAIDYLRTYQLLMERGD